MKQLLSWINPKKLNSFYLSTNINAIDFLFNYSNYNLINWDGLSKNINEKSVKYLNYMKWNINWANLSTNPSSIELLTNNQNKINWFYLSKNNNAIELLTNNQNKINWDNLSLNQNAIYANNLREVGRISAPTWQAAFKFFREKYKLYFNFINVGLKSEGGLMWSIIWNGNPDEAKAYGIVKTYEEAQQTALEKLCEIVELKKD